MKKSKFINSSSELYSKGFFTPLVYKKIKNVEYKYPVKIPYSYFKLIDKNDKNCPIARQSIPCIKEIEKKSNGLKDPVGDRVHEKINGIIHRYKNRILIIPSYNCFINCRFCFRKNIKNKKAALVHDVKKYLAKNPEINEVILSGGDPLTLSDKELKNWLKMLYKSHSVKKIRIHTRAPVVYPERLTSPLYRILSESPIVIIMSTHINHPKELTAECKKIFNKLRKIGIINISQTVLLKGVNDSAEILYELFDKLTNAGCIPYYLHHPDMVEGGIHFLNSIQHGVSIFSRLLERLSGISIPRYMLDLPHGKGKAPINLNRCIEWKKGTYKVLGLKNIVSIYKDLNL